MQLDAESMGVVAAYDMYRECCDGELEPHWANNQLVEEALQGSHCSPAPCWTAQISRNARRARASLKTSSAEAEEAEAG